MRILESRAELCDYIATRMQDLHITKNDDNELVLNTSLYEWEDGSIHDELEESIPISEEEKLIYKYVSTFKCESTCDCLEKLKWTSDCE